MICAGLPKIRVVEGNRERNYRNIDNSDNNRVNEKSISYYG